MPGSRPTWYLTHEYVGRDQTCDLQKLQVAPLTVPLFLEGPNGATAHTTLRIVNAYNFGGFKTATATALRVYPPNQKKATYIDFTFPALVKKGTIYMMVTGPVMPGAGFPGGTI